MAFVIRNPIIGTQGIHETDTVRRQPLGQEVQAYDPVYGEATFVYARGVASTVVGSVVLINQDDYSTALTVADQIGKIGVAMSANVANSFGWYQITGKAVAKVAAGFVDNANVYLTATAGVVDDAVVAGDRIKNCKGASAIGTIVDSNGVSITLAAELEIDRPFVDDGLAA